MHNSRRQLAERYTKNILRDSLDKQEDYKMNNKTEIILDEIVNVFVSILKDNLVGIYLHGSLAMECFNPQKSDIDLLIVIRKKLERKEMEIIVEALIDLETIYHSNPIEMSIILENDIKNFKHPMPFILHYSELHREKYISSKELCGDFNDLDLTSHLMVLKSRGKCLYGLAVNHLNIRISEGDFLKSVLNDLNYNEDDLLIHPEYVVLNLCRTLKYLNDKSLSSKLEGGQWAIGKFGRESDEIIKKMIDKYTYGSEVNVLVDDISCVAKSLLCTVFEMTS